MELIQPTKLSRQRIDQWPVKSAGFNARVVHCLERAKINSVGELRLWSDKRLLALRSFGAGSMQDVRWFFRWTERLEKGEFTVADLRQWLREFLNDRELSVLERRYGLNDPLFRPTMKRMTLQEIADQLGGVTRERARQMEEAGLTKLRSHLGRAVAAPLEMHLVKQMKHHGGAVSSKDLSDWQGDPVMGAYQPWGGLILLSDTLEGIHARYGCFCCLSYETVLALETAVLQVLREARTPVAFDAIRARVAVPTRSVGVEINSERLLRVLLDYHPEINGTLDGRYFLLAHGTEALIVEILRAVAEPVHYYEITRRYNELMQPPSRRGTGFILHLLRGMSAAQRVGLGQYRLRGA